MDFVSRCAKHRFDYLGIANIIQEGDYIIAEACISERLRGASHDLDASVEEILAKGGLIAVEPFKGQHGEWRFKNACIQDPDGYSLVLGGDAAGSEARFYRERPVALTI